MPFALQKIDCRLQPSSINLGLLSAMNMIEPFGAGNPQPCFGLFGVRIDDVSGISEGKHIRMTVSKNGFGALSVHRVGMEEACRILESAMLMRHHKGFLE